MIASTSLSVHIAEFIAERERLGFSVRKDASILRNFERYIDETGHHGPLTTEVMASWARRDSHGSEDLKTWARRLKNLRTFMRWMQQFDPLTEVPTDAVFGRLPGRLAPHIYTDSEIVDLLAAAKRLGPKSTLRGIVYETLFGLIASTGLRISEALSLRNQDLDLKNGILTVHQSKFGKSRQIPLHLTTVKVLRRYCIKRDLSGSFSENSAPLFISTRGRRCGMTLSNRQVHRVFAQLRQQLQWKNRGTHHAPRIHDLRHTFIVNRILQWQRQGLDVDSEMLSLSTYVGHAMVTNTYWYLSAVPELMKLASDSFESLASRAKVSNE